MVASRCSLRIGWPRQHRYAVNRWERFSLEIRVVLVTWRSVMRQIRNGLVPDPRESALRVTALSLELLADSGTRYPELNDDAHAIALLREAREEIHGATVHDLADTAELNA
jgi:hypothetical protein